MPSNWPPSTLKSVSQAFNVLNTLHGKGWMCRGQRECFDNLIPSIDRDELLGLSRTKKLTLECGSIDLFRSTVRFFADDGERIASGRDIGTLMVLRHYGVPTRFVDWSLSPHVAAYFASVGDPRKDGEIWSFDHELYKVEGTKQWAKWTETTTDGSGDADKFDFKCTAAFTVKEPHPWFVCLFYPAGFHRQTAQLGFFSLTAKFRQDHAVAIANLLNKPTHYHRYVVPAKLKPKLRKLLRENHGIWRGSLFPDSAGAAETATLVFPRGSVGSAIDVYREPTSGR
jgi:hypothetical protein